MITTPETKERLAYLSEEQLETMIKIHDEVARKQTFMADLCREVLRQKRIKDATAH